MPKRYPDSLAEIESAISQLDATHVVPSHVQPLKPFDRFLGLVHQAPNCPDPAGVLDEAEKAVAPLLVAVAAAGSILQGARVALGILPDDEATTDSESGL